MASKRFAGAAVGLSRRACLGTAALVCTERFTLHDAQAQMSPPITSVQAPESASADGTDSGGYVSPYALRFSVPQPLLDAGFDAAPWNDPDAESNLSAAVWQDQNAHALGAAWGPPARQYPAPSLPHSDAGYRRERVISVAARHIGLSYQHHHLPSWQPPGGWPWLPVKIGANGPGLDCSNFSSFVFNYALGVKLPTGIGRQAALRRLAGPGGEGCLTAQLIRDQFAAVIAALQPADLLYFRNPQGRIRHVALWVGAIGQTADQAPAALVIDCSQHRHRDGQGNAIPPGVWLRPFTADSWYAAHLSHVHRLIGATSALCDATPGPAPEGDDRA
ncbi:C40 family peptidase [Acidisoma cellulosilytica]|uniref:C40 family peptidase n=1 Tax=Acidisoma cellulosilyticum TaxID=2802395 RepID=A0A963YZ51_9PROT|nr:NlpC/P60 family protein [Acidisoma cellulosilyticum]MCB8879754.1 C40 family peptidase [Acidisoma cellulosilyticum]